MRAIHASRDRTGTHLRLTLKAVRPKLGDIRELVVLDDGGAIQSRRAFAPMSARCTIPSTKNSPILSPRSSFCLTTSSRPDPMTRQSRASS
jgi:hypothetical protein